MRVFKSIFKKKSIAVAIIKGPGHGVVRVNGTPLDLIQPHILKLKLFEPFLLLGNEKFGDIDIRIRVKGGGQVSRIYAIRQAISRGILRYIEKFVNESEKMKLRNIYLNYDRSLLVTDSRMIESKKAGGRGARSRFQKSYR
jgi:small subunit ribosomal protein S16e|mmetsp:Transcript_19811/g.29118  ORF Transcript_19811/g.29118 Transcript_19811/m.29118 type:complete len:141 (+) Transcript_19811:90-512(+)